MPEVMKFPGLGCTNEEWELQLDYRFYVHLYELVCKHCSEVITTTEYSEYSHRLVEYTTSVCPRVIVFQSSEGGGDEVICLDCVEEALQKLKVTQTTRKEVPDV